MSLAQPLTTRLTRLRERLRSHRPQSEEDEEDGELIWAAVAVILAPDPDALLLIRRAEHPGDPWSGHMALPGGRRGEGDSGLLATAVRETHEEVGVPLSPEHLIGVLDDVIPRIPVLPPIAVRPYVFSLPSRPALTPNPEVAATRWVDLDRLLPPGAPHAVRLEVAGISRQVAAYQLGDAVVWGMTERIITMLLTLIRSDQP